MPQRFLRPGIRNSARWNSVSRTAQVLYVGILTLVDDYGQFDGRVSVIHGECFSVWNDLHQDNPQESAATRCALQELAAASMIEIWTNKEGKLVVEVTQWQERVREGAKRKWGIRRNPQESAGIRSEILPPSPPPPPSPTTVPIASTSSPLPPTERHAPRFVKPAEAEAKIHGLKLGLPETECVKFWNFYESKGWMVGKNPMKSWQSAMVNWRGNWSERNNHHAPERNQIPEQIKIKVLDFSKPK